MEHAVRVYLMLHFYDANEGLKFYGTTLIALNH